MASFPVRSFLIIFCCTICGVVVGLIVGLILGSIAPDFGRALFGYRSGNEEYAFDGRQLGIGLGIANGVWVGLFAGIALVIAEAIKYLKKD